MIEFITGYGILLGYFAMGATVALVLRRLIKIPQEIFRKILHMILLGSIFIFTYVFKTWWISALATIAFVAMVFPILMFAERIPGYSELLIERKKGEIKRSLVIVFCMFFVLICVCRGWLDQNFLIIASVLAWGLGDAAAALVGKRFGRHFIEGKRVEGRKSLEGTFAMFIVSFISVLSVLLINGSLERSGYLPVALTTAVVSAVVELYTRGGMDTLTCPFAAAAVMIPLVHLWRI